MTCTGGLLGAGSYGRVYQAVWRKQDVAVKVWLAPVLSMALPAAGL